jgi:uncharacterized protein (DUF486 family)
MNKWIAIIFLYIASVCYITASFYHLSLGVKWTFIKAFLISITFVILEYVFGIPGNKWANEFLPVFDLMILIIVFDLINLFILNFFILKNEVQPLKHGLCLILLGIVIMLSADVINNTGQISDKK